LKFKRQKSGQIFDIHEKLRTITAQQQSSMSRY